MDKKCFICGYDIIVHEHHIIPLSEGGCECDDNKVMLCPNHHGFLTHQKKHPFESKKIKEQLPQGKKYNECQLCNNKRKAMQKVLDLAFDCIDLEDNELKRKYRIEMLELQLEFNFDMSDVLSRLMGYSKPSIELAKTHSRINKEKQLKKLKGEL